MGKGGCKQSSTDEATLVKSENILEKERKDKINAESKFIWAHDEEPHRRR
jgi:hypothetical protein